ncbi:hypothetical protein BC829DRAFT_427313 [Chytridium lagenaria]|nr:hypothetical protein BC829DRAFT_427313 [Chytridium lagenaria]
MSMFVGDQVVMDGDAVQDEQHEDDIMQSEDFLEIDKLQDVGINAADISKLKAMGMQTVRVRKIRPNDHDRNLLKIKGMSEAKIEKIKEASQKLLSSGFITGTDYCLKRKHVFRITTGSREFDKILGGGIESASITEAFGEFRTGKTQLAHTLCVAAQLPFNMGGAGGKSYVCTCTFRDDRIRAIAARFCVDPDAALDNILIARAFNSEAQMDLLIEVAARMVDGDFRLLVVDSIIALFRTDYSGRLNGMLARLMRLAEEFNVAVFITNQMCADPGAAMSFVADPKKPIGGHVLAHASTTRLYLRKGRGETRICKIYDSPSVPEAEAMYQISEGGIIDSKE